MQLVPDIEFRLYESTKSKPREKVDTDENVTVGKMNQRDGRAESDDSELDDNDCDILERLARVIEKNGYVCIPQNEQTVSSIQMRIRITFLE